MHQQQNRHPAGRTTNSEKNGSRRAKVPLPQEGVTKEAMRPARQTTENKSPARKGITPAEETLSVPGVIIARSKRKVVNVLPARVARAVRIEEATVPPVKVARVLPAGNASTKVNDARGATLRVAGQRDRTALVSTAPNAEPMLPLPTETAADRNVRKRTNRQKKNRKRRNRESYPGSSDGRSNEIAYMTTC
jgi:hypothetical protein